MTSKRPALRKNKHSSFECRDVVEKVREMRLVKSYRVAISPHNTTFKLQARNVIALIHHRNCAFNTLPAADLHLVVIRSLL